MSDDRQIEAVLEATGSTAEFGGLRWSAEIDKLIPALVAAQAKTTDPQKTAKNPYFNSKYAPLDESLPQTRRVLAEVKIKVIQMPSLEWIGDTPYMAMTTMLVHESGQWIGGVLKMPAEGAGKDGRVKFDAQTIGSASSYARRYSIEALMGMAATEDDDGNAASGNEGKQKPAQRPPIAESRKAMAQEVAKAETPKTEKPSARAEALYKQLDAKITALMGKGIVSDAALKRGRTNMEAHKADAESLAGALKALQLREAEVAREQVTVPVHDEPGDPPEDSEDVPFEDDPLPEPKGEPEQKEIF